MLEIKQTSTELAEPENWKARQYQLESYWAQQIKSSRPGAGRRMAYKEAYSAVNALLAQYTDFKGSLSDHACAQIKILEKVSDGRELKFLEIGCARGDLLVLTSRLGWRSFGVDVESGCVAAARQKLEEMGIENAAGRIVEGELPDLAEDDFDLIFHSDVLEHLHPEDVPGFLKSCFLKTADHGQLVLITPNTLIGPADISRSFVPPGAPAQGLHLKEYSLLELNELLRLAGYTRIKGFLIHPESRFFFDRQPRSVYHRMKMAFEIFFRIVPPRYRRRILARVMVSLYYSCVIAQK